MSRPFIPANNCASIELIYTTGGNITENVLHVKKSTPYSGPDLVALRNAVNAWDNAHWANLRALACQLFRIRCKALDSPASPVDDFLLTTPRGGGQSTGVMPSNVAFCIKAATGLAGRSQRGRLYVTGIADTWVTGPGNNDVPSAFVGFWVGALNQLITDLATAGSTLVVVSYRKDHAWRVAAQATPVTLWTATDFHLDSQRRRLIGR